jgi:elongation factor Ts
MMLFYVLFITYLFSSHSFRSAPLALRRNSLKAPTVNSFKLFDSSSSENQATVSMDLIKVMREKTGAGLMKCREALVATNGNLQEAIKWFRQQAYGAVEKKLTRDTPEGVIGFYLHPGAKIASMVELACETDFVARNEKFLQLANDLAQHLTFHHDEIKYLNESQITDLDREEATTKAFNSWKEENQVESDCSGDITAEEEQRVIEEKAEELLRSTALLTSVLSRTKEESNEEEKEEQQQETPEKLTVEDHIRDHIISFGENIRINRFVTYKIRKS